MVRRAEHRQPVTITLPPELIERLERTASDLGVSRSEAAYRAIRNGLEMMESLTENPVGRALLSLGELLADPQTQREVELMRKRIEERKRQPDLPGFELGGA